MRAMSALELNEYLQQNKPALIDVREPWEFEICHIEGSVNIPMGQTAQSVQEFKKQESVVICHHGVRSLHVIQFLQQQSIDDLINLEGGIDSWAREVDPAMAVY